MKTLDLNAYGVSEMTKQEMQETNGGEPISFGCALLIGLAVGFIVGTIAFFVKRNRAIEEFNAAVA